MSEVGTINDYLPFNFVNSLPFSATLITGIRKINNTNLYVITGFYEYPDEAQKQASFVFKGNLNQFGKWYILNYPSSLTTSLYGPSVDNYGIYTIVGSYTNSNPGQIGCLYIGDLNGNGIWRTIIPTPLTSSPIINTICHSNDGDLLVGNYDTELLTGIAFIYNIRTEQYIAITLPNQSNVVSSTAYGIVHNGKGVYTICGGVTFSSPFRQQGYVVDYVVKTGEFRNLRLYQYANNPNSIITHFNGISKLGNDDCQYTLTGDFFSTNDPIHFHQPRFRDRDDRNNNSGAFFCNIKRTRKGRFSNKAQWKRLNFRETLVTSGNSVSENVIIGVYIPGSRDRINGFVSYNN